MQKINMQPTLSLQADECPISHWCSLWYPAFWAFQSRSQVFCSAMVLWCCGYHQENGKEGEIKGNSTSCRRSWKHCSTLCFSFKGTCGMDHVLAAVLAVYAKWVRSDGNSHLLLWMYVSDTVTETAGDLWQWELQQIIQELASALTPPGSELPYTGMT